MPQHMEAGGDPAHSRLTVTCRTLVQPKHNKVDPSSRKMCNSEVKAAL